MDGSATGTSGPWTADLVKKSVEGDIERLLAPWMVGRPPNYSMDESTRNTVATGYWLDEQLTKLCSDADRKTQCWKFNRMSRTYDIFETAAECMNEAIEGQVEQNRRPRRRWG